MENTYDNIKMIAQMAKFVAYVQAMDGIDGPLSFRNNNGILDRQENYKLNVVNKAREALRVNEWKKSWIDKHLIAECAVRAMRQASNLVNSFQKLDFYNRLNPAHKKYRKDAEQVLYDFYTGAEPDGPEMFKRLTNVFGRKYDIIAFLFYIKDYSNYLPLRPEVFDEIFSKLGIDHSMYGRCGWDNYQKYIQIVREVRDLMQEVMPMQAVPQLIDAHSFLWITGETVFINWDPDSEIEAKIEESIERVISGKGGRHLSQSHVYSHSAAVTKATKERAGGICQFCGQAAPFTDRTGKPYLEAHHIIWLSRGGSDSTDNTAALCPNCHTRMHVVDDPQDVLKLQEKIAKL